MSEPRPTPDELLGCIEVLQARITSLAAELERVQEKPARYDSLPSTPVRNSAYSWARAFAVQALADLAARDALLSHSEVKVCQQLHFLQMAAEKVSKAHRCFGGEDPGRLQFSHAYAAKVLPLIARAKFPADVSRQSDIDRLRQLAREIDLLAPTVKDDGRRPDNCEYPWEDADGRLLTPAESTFTKLAGLDRFEMGKTLLKVIHVAAIELAGDTPLLE